MSPISKGLLKEYAWKVLGVPKALYKSAKTNPMRTKRMAKVSLSLTLAMALTLPAPFAAFLGSNPFLLGTVAIYLFPIRTIGAQLVAASIGLSGVMLGIAYANLIIFIANSFQDDNLEHVQYRRKALLFGAFSLGAMACGYARSKFTRSYLAINFFMVVNMFALIRGINHIEYAFRNFFYVMLFGASISTVICFLFWPEDHSTALKGDIGNGIREAQLVVDGIRNSVWTNSCTPVDLEGLKSAQAKLAASLHEANYEISFSRVESAAIVPFGVCLARMIALGRVFNAAMRRRSRQYRQIRRIEDLTNSSFGARIETRDIIHFAFSTAIEMFDVMAVRIQALYRGDDDVAVDNEKFETLINDLRLSNNNEIQRRSVMDARDVEEAAFTDQVNNVILDIFEAIKDSARNIQGIEKHGLRVVLPRKLYAEDEETRHPTLIEGEDGLVLLREATTALDRLGIFISEKILAFRNSRHVKYSIKFCVVMSIIAFPAFISDWNVWYEDLRFEWALISAMVAMETTRGMTFRTGGMKLAGALMGGFSAFAVMQISQGAIYVIIIFTLFVGLFIGYLVLHPTFAKAGTVYALAYNIILGVATIFPDQGPITWTFARRIFTLPIGLMVAILVHLMLFPFRSRLALSKTLSSSLDWLHHLLYAIEASAQHPTLQHRFEEMVHKAARRIQFAKNILPATRYEVSLAGHWPFERFEHILEKIVDVTTLIVGEKTGHPIMARQLVGRTCETLRTKVLASLCNDLLVISHTLTARLFMPKNESLSTLVLHEYIEFLSRMINAEIEAGHKAPKKNFTEVGRLADLVNEITLLREQVDELITETQCPKTGLLPHLSFVIKKSRPPTPEGGVEAV
ncbi:hypothetical protein RUND412_001420 [Rhizina undulata]